MPTAKQKQNALFAPSKIDKVLKALFNVQQGSVLALTASFLCFYLLLTMHLLVHR